MTSNLLLTWRRPGSAEFTAAAVPVGSADPTGILDWKSPAVDPLAAAVGSAGSQLDRPRRAHAVVGRAVRPVYSVAELRPVSKTIRLGRGSCSQRLAVLEALARRAGIATRSHALIVEGSFWYPRFPLARPLVPNNVVLAWPEFYVDGHWLSAGSMFAVGDHVGGRFTNEDETLFDALGHTHVQWARSDEPDDRWVCGDCDLSRWVTQDLGRYISRDEVFRIHGQTLCVTARLAAEPFMGRWSPRSTRR